MTADEALREMRKWMPVEEDHLLHVVLAELKALREKVEYLEGQTGIQKWSFNNMPRFDDEERKALEAALDMFEMCSFEEGLRYLDIIRAMLEGEKEQPTKEET